MAKSVPKMAVIIVLLVILVVVAALLLFKSQLQKPEPTPYPATSTQPSTSVAPPTSQASPAFFAGTFPPGSKEIAVSVQKKGKTVELSWDDSNFQVFFIGVADDEQFRKSAITVGTWTISSLKADTVGDQMEDVSGFIPSGYVIGSAIEGFQSPKLPAALELKVGKQYYMQLTGFTKEGVMTTVNKEFTFT
ncbi:MAG TPA: hypothetical protein VI934_03775 [Candidatus Nanoarchaeia archaeon]|nr:hypothetical protein [Candidatus Nanoarchaeia archaeon]